MLSDDAEARPLDRVVESGEYPVLPLRDIVVFPYMIVPLFVGRRRSVAALEKAMSLENLVFLVTQRDASDDNPIESGLFEVGTLASVLQLLKLPDGTVKVLVEGRARGQAVHYVDSEAYMEARVEVLEDDASDKVKVEALGRSVVNEFENYVKLNKKIAPEVLTSIGQISNYSCLADTVASHLAVKTDDKQAILEMTSLSQRLKNVLEVMESEISVLQMEKRIRTRVKIQMEKTQREYYLNEQMKAIQKELGDSDGARDDFAEFEERIEKTKLSKEAREKALSELKKLRHMSPVSAEAAVVRNFLDWILSLPWKRRSRKHVNLPDAQEILDRGHYGLTKIKERILEYFAVQSRVGNRMRGPILCLVGPPGVGKTSLGRSIAEATGREFVRLSLGGVRDEAEIRGHRRTYIGAMPGKIIQSMRKSRIVNPLILLDEVDKMGTDYRGDPASALLEVLDPEQNATFSDHYLEVDYDLSKVMFVATANTLDIPPALLDRMEVIRISGYTEDEKRAVANKHLIPRVFKEHGLDKNELVIDDDALLTVIRRYTREAGVRNLEREIAKLSRKVVKKLILSGDKSVTVDSDNLANFLGAPKYNLHQIESEARLGIVTGLAWTEMGGELLTIESVVMPGTGQVGVTGNLRDVMKESISAAIAYVRSRASEFGIVPDIFKKRDIHVHVPEAAMPKDGPSAGVAMITAMISVLTNIPVRHDVAMTGEITLRGRVLPIGGVKEKLLAASRGGIEVVLIPEDNVKDLDDVPDSVKSAVEIIPVSQVDEVIKVALVRTPQPIEWEEDTQSVNEPVGGGGSHGDHLPVRAH